MPKFAYVPADELEKYGAAAKLWALMERVAEDPSSVPGELRQMWLVWVYDAEVNNGGHLQYFHNQGTEVVPETLQVLRSIGGEDHARLLETCWSVVNRTPITPVNSLSKYADLAVTRSFRAEDRTFYSLPNVVDLLVERKQDVLDEFVEVHV